VPLPTGLQDAPVTRTTAALVVAALVCGSAAALFASRVQPGAAFFVRSFDNPSDRREARPDILDTPILPGSIMKAVTLAAALDSQVIEPTTARMCRRSVTVAGTTYTCTHPDLKRPLTPAEALAHSCNDFFVSLAPRLTLTMFNRTRAALGLPPVSAGANLPASFVGLDGPRLSPRVLLDIVARLVGADRQRAVTLGAEAQRVLRDGLRGAAEYGSASSLREASVPALAKTGTAPMPGGGWMGLVVAFVPPDHPTRGVVVVAPGAAGRDAASIAADLLRARTPASPAASAGSAVVPEGRRGSSTTAGRAADADARVTVRISIRGRVTPLALEEYIARVLAGEGQPTAREAAQQALAITARTFALANLNRHRREGYDLCDTTHCQVLRASTEVTRRAAESTAGLVLAHNGQPASVFYSALCGGRSEMASEVWPGAIDYLAASQADDACRDEPAWTSEISARDIEAVLRSIGLRGSRLRDLRIVQRNSSGRVSRLRVDGFTPADVSGHDFRTAIGRHLGWQHLKSTAFDIKRTSSGYRFSGTGFGHGVGLCVIGAGRRASRGSTADDILRFYFPTLSVQPYRSTRPASSVAPAVASVDVLLALPASEESERARLMALVRSARDEIASRANVKPPATIRVTVHPTVEAFARATGQPWWVSGATDGSTIDLLPLNILRQRGQLDRTIRREVAHVVIDDALRNRRLWVREGLAFYFADPAAAVDTDARPRCPSDDEFLKPLSAGAHRAAYARAEACVRRALSRGTSWRDVR
jgi:SpoIID/LytB domain protein